MSEWKEIELGQVCKLKGGFAFKSNDFKIEGVPLVKISNIQNNKTVKSNGDVFISEKYLETHSNFVLKNNDVVIAMSGATTGKIGKVNEIFTPSFLNQRVGLFLSKDESKVDLELIYQIFSQDTLIQHILGNAGSSAQPNISPSFLENIKILLPDSKPEQTRIAEILSTVDTSIEQTEELIAKYQRIKTGLMQDLLTKGIDEHGNIRSKETHRFVIKNGIEVPEEWEVEKLDNIVTQVLDFKANGSFETLTENVKYYYTQNYARLIRLTDLRNGLKETGVFIDEKGFHFLKKTRLVAGDIMISCVGEYTGFVCQMPKVPYYATIAPNMFVVRFKEKVINSFAYYYMTSFDFQNQIKIVSTSSATKLLNNPNLRSLKLVIPSEKEQYLISQKIKAIDDNIKSEENQLVKFKVVKIGLMQDLLSGKVRVKV